MTKKIVEVRWHGRGGQGAKSAAQFLAEAAMESGKHIQAFPEYGPERAGAPMRAFTRISDHPIRLHCGVTNPGFVVVVDSSLITEDALEGLPDDGVLVANTGETPQELRDRLKFRKGKVATVDATAISLKNLGIPMPNTPMLGALLKIAPLVSLEQITHSIENKFIKKIGADKTRANMQCIKDAYNEVKVG